MTDTFAKINSTDHVLSCLSNSSALSVVCKQDKPVTHCYYTATVDGIRLKFNSHETKPVYNISCDYSNICFNKTENEFIQIGDNSTGTTHLYCCSTNNCNKPIFKDVRQCYNVFNTNGSAKGTKEDCLHSDSQCTKITYIKQTEKVEYFSCVDGLGSNGTAHCRNVTSSKPQCFNVSLQNTPVELCCCHGDLCIVPPFNYTESHTLLHLNITNGTIWIDGSHDLPPKKEKEYTDWLFVGGLISAGVLILLIITAAIIIGVKCRKRKETDRMMLSYTRVAADATPDDDEDIRMLLG